MEKATANRLVLLGYYLAGLMSVLVFFSLPSLARQVVMGVVFGVGLYVAAMWLVERLRKPRSLPNDI